MNQFDPEVARRLSEPYDAVYTAVCCMMATVASHGGGPLDVIDIAAALGLGEVDVSEALAELDSLDHLDLDGDERFEWSGKDEDACPGCGCKPGDGITDTCDHPDGCGYFKALADEEADQYCKLEPGAFCHGCGDCEQPARCRCGHENTPGATTCAGCNCKLD